MQIEMVTLSPKSKQRELLRPTVIDIDLDCLVENLRIIRELAAPARVMPILKANAYGHGLAVCAEALESAGADAFGVAFLEEAVLLRKAGITIPILCLGGISGRQIDGFLQYNIDITASSVMKLEMVDERAAALGVKARVQLKVDTGMERIGVHYYSAESLFSKMVQCKHCECTGVFSHFATAEQEDLSLAKLQLERFLESLRFFDKNSLKTPPRHIANSGALLSMPESHLDLVRPGLILFGVSPALHLAPLLQTKRVLALRSEVSFFKVVEEGAGVSYDHLWHAPKQTRIVTIPAGYGDGYSRGLSNKGEILIRGKRYPIVGKVCMDQFMADIGWNTAYNGDEVVLIGRQGREEITVEEIAVLLNTDPRDVLCALNARVPRRFWRAGDALFEEMDG